MTLLLVENSDQFIFCINKDGLNLEYIKVSEKFRHSPLKNCSPGGRSMGMCFTAIGNTQYITLHEHRTLAKRPHSCCHTLSVKFNKSLEQQRRDTDTVHLIGRLDIAVLTLR